MNPSIIKEQMVSPPTPSKFRERIIEIDDAICSYIFRLNGVILKVFFCWFIKWGSFLSAFGRGMSDIRNCCPGWRV